jgi:hypothetical protein
MGCSVTAGIFVGFSFDEVGKIVEKKDEKFVTKYDEDTGKPYQKDVSEFTKSLEVFGQTIDCDEDELECLGEVTWAIEKHFKKEKIVATYGEGDDISDILIGVYLVQTGDLMYGGGNDYIDLGKLEKTIEKLKKYGKTPSVILTTSVSC